MKTTAILTILALTFCCASAAQGVTFEWATIGNLGNPDDIHGFGYGGVDYRYRISKYEVTNAQYVEFLNAVADSDPNGLYNTSMWLNDRGCKIERTGEEGNYSYSIAADRANRPVNYVSFYDAMRFVNWLENGQPIGTQGADTTESGVYTISVGTSGIRNPGATYFIPSEDEWYKAAYHKNDGVTGNYWDYPTQSDSEPNNDLIDPDPGNNANFYQDGGRTIGSPYWTTEVGEFENSESAYGTFDQGGNVWEWNETFFTSDYPVLRGGSFGTNFDAFLSSAVLRAEYRIGFQKGNEVEYVGFRVASIPEPGGIALLLCAATTGLMWWWPRRGVWQGRLHHKSRSE